MHSIRRFAIRPTILASKRYFKGLPFKVSYEEANKIITQNTSIFEKTTTSDALTIYKGDVIKEKFIPFHSASIKGLKTSFTGKFGIDRSETYIYYVYNGKTMSPMVGTRIVTDWYNTSGTIKSIDYPFGLKDTQIYAGFTYPRNYVELVLANEDVTNIKTLTNEMLHDHKGNKRIIEKHGMNIGFGLEKIVNRLYELEKRRAENYIKRYHNADRAEVDQLGMHLDQCAIELYSYHLPAFVYQFDQNNKDIKLFKIVNGYTGIIDGDKIYSPIKAFLASSVLGIVIVPLFGPATVPLLIGRAIIGGIITGTPAALWAKFQHIHKAHKIIAENEKEFKYNATFQETDDDVKRRQDADTFNESSNNNNNDSNNFHEFNDNADVTLSEKYTILGLNYNNREKFNREDIKRAYRVQMHKWHPDIYKGNKTVANKMSCQINEAYNVLSKVHKQ